jgi:hypothetical protein
VREEQPRAPRRRPLALEPRAGQLRWGCYAPCCSDLLVRELRELLGETEPTVPAPVDTDPLPTSWLALCEVER